MGHQREAHSFVLRIWLEDPPTDEESARWRAHHQRPRRRSQVVQDFHHVEAFLKEYVQQWNAPPPAA